MITSTTTANGRPRRYLWGLAVALAVACGVAFAEIDAQSARVVDSVGRAWPISVLIGPGAGERAAGWVSVLSSGLVSDPLYRALFSWHLVIDLVFVITYASLLAGLVLVMFRGSRTRWLFLGVVALTALADLVEDLSIVVLLATRRESAWLVVLDAATTAKWLLLGFVLLALVVRLAVPRRTGEVAAGSDARAIIVRIRKALMHHRFSVALILPLVVLTLLSGSAILEQLPDVQRRWVSDGARGWWQAGFAIAALALVAVLLEVLARFRTGWAERHQEPPAPSAAATPAPAGPWLGNLIARLWADLLLSGRMVVELVVDRGTLRRRLRHLLGRQDALLAVWLLAIAIPVLAALIAWPVMDAPVLWVRLLVFCVIPAVVVAGSWILRRAWQIRPDWHVPYTPPHYDPDEVHTIRFTGHALALAALSVGGVGLIRSYISVVILGPDFTGVGRGLAAVFLALGVAGVVLPWLLSWALATGAANERVTDPLAAVGASEPQSLKRRWALLVTVLAGFVALGLFPGQFAWLGVSAVTILSLSALIAIPAATGLLIQERPTPEIFRLLGLHRTPLVGVLVFAVVLAGLTAGSSTIHRVADQSAVPAPERPAVSTLVRDWLAQPGACEVMVDGQRVRPAIMVAAEGGGIRATYWTVQSLAALDRATGGCGARSALFSGGASGGSVGLTVARFSGTPDDPGTARAVAAVRAMAEPQTLGEAVIGTFVRDLAYGATGVPLGSNGAAPPRTWADRARLIELGWDGSAAGDPWGTRPYLTEAAALSPATGPLVLNSSSVASECRAWVSQLGLEQPATSDGEQRCDQRVGPGARTVDLFAAYGPVGGSGAECLSSVEASTAALLTARFPYVTPGGVAGGCAANATGSDFWPRTQLIDGGYIENTGLATITDLSAEWLAQVRMHNEEVAAGRSREPLIVPFVVFLTNGQVSAGRLTEPPALQSELLLPAVGYLRGSATLTQPDALLQRVATTVRTRSICPPPGTGPIDCDRVADAFPRRVIVVDRTAQPEVTAPLGWVLSQASMTGLDRAIAHQVQTTCEAAPNEPVCLRGYGTLGELIGYLGH